MVSIPPQVQENINKQMLSKLNNKISKFAHVSSNDIFASTSVEQLFDENKQRTYKDKFFDSFELAKTWLIQK